MPGFGGELDHVKGHPQDRSLAQGVDPADVGAPSIDVLQYLEQLLVVVVLELKLQRPCEAQGQEEKGRANHTCQLAKEMWTRHGVGDVDEASGRLRGRLCDADGDMDFLITYVDSFFGNSGETCRFFAIYNWDCNFCVVFRMVSLLYR